VKHSLALAHYRAVNHPQLRRITVEIEPGSEPPRGRLLAHDAIHPFAGWLGLAAALSRAIDGEHDPQPERPPPLADG